MWTLMIVMVHTCSWHYTSAMKLVIWVLVNENLSLYQSFRKLAAKNLVAILSYKKKQLLSKNSKNISFIRNPKNQTKSLVQVLCENPLEDWKREPFSEMRRKKNCRLLRSVTQSEIVLKESLLFFQLSTYGWSHVWTVSRIFQEISNVLQVLYF